MADRMSALAARFRPRRLRGAATQAWTRFWMRFAALPMVGRPCTWLASRVVPPYYGRHRLAALHPHGHTAPSARIHHRSLRRGAHTSLGDRVTIYQDHDGGPVTIGDRSTINDDCYLQTGQGGTIEIGPDTHLQPRCQLSAYVGSIRIGARISIAPNVAFYPYDHGIQAGIPVRQQPLESKGDIVIEDDVWIGTGVIVLAGVHIGAGAVVAAGSIVTRRVPADAVVAGSPARVIRLREPAPSADGQRSGSTDPATSDPATSRPR
jgi:acetyltransferase-like isoleucine patch superfamily enzyme